MGAWDTGSFANDTALDFAADLSDFATIRSTIAQFANTPTNDADDASVALAACEFLAAAIGRPPADLPKAPNFEDQDISDTLLTTAKAIIEQVRKTSELAELWAEDDDSAWQAELDELLIRLTPSMPYKAPKKKKREKLPDDFLGHCYICYGPVTERDGILFEHDDEGVVFTTHPHRKCIEDKISGPHWKADGSPTKKVEKLLLRDMGFDV